MQSDETRQCDRVCGRAGAKRARSSLNTIATVGAVRFSFQRNFCRISAYFWFWSMYRAWWDFSGDYRREIYNQSLDVLPSTFLGMIATLALLGMVAQQQTDLPARAANHSNYHSHRLITHS